MDVVTWFRFYELVFLMYVISTAENASLASHWYRSTESMAWRDKNKSSMTFNAWNYTDYLLRWFMYFFVPAALHYYWIVGTAGTVEFDTVTAVLGANILVLKLWEPAFFMVPNMRKEKADLGFPFGYGALLSMSVSGALVGTSLYVLCIFGLDALWVPFGLYIPYTVYCFWLLWVSFIVGWKNSDKRGLRPMAAAGYRPVQGQSGLVYVPRQ